MLLAIYRGFANSTNWSPLAIMLVVVLSVVPGTSWEQVVPLGFLFGAGLNMLGYEATIPRKPTAPLTPEQEAQLREAFIECKLLEK